MALTVVTEEMVDAVLERAPGGIEHAHTPFPHSCGFVSSRLEDFGYSHRISRKRTLAFRLDLAVCACWAVPHVQAGKEGCTSRCADARASVGGKKTCAFIA